MHLANRLPAEAHTARPWRVHEITRDFTPEDVWLLPFRGRAEDFPRLVDVVMGLDPSHGGGRLSDALWAVRWKLGELFGWDDEGAGLDSRVATLRDRLPADLAAGPRGPAPSAVPFRPLFLTDEEYAAEIANRTVHGVLHLGAVPDPDDPDGAVRVQLAVIVKPNGPLGRAYLTAIRPFRRLVVYPALMRRGQDLWERAAAPDGGART
ncbi:MAG: DUF2867 domain-containing protein [Actinomycetes bacterium]